MRMGAVYTAFFLFVFALPFETGVFAQEQGEPAEMQIKASVKAAPKKARVTSPKKAGARPPSQRSGGVLAKHLEMAVLVDAQSRSLEAQFRATSARYATANSITPGSPYVEGLQRNSVAGNLRNYNETEVEVGMPLWLPGQRDAYAGTVTTGLFEVEERLALRRLEVAGVLRDAWWTAQRAAREVSVARNRVATARDIGADMTRRVELGDAAQTDALLAENETLAAETELAQSEGAVKVARATYAGLTGGAQPDGKLESVRPPIDIEEHPALRAPVAALARARAQAELVDATPIPSPEIGIFGRQEHNDQYATDRSLDLLDPITNQRTDATTVGVRIRFPLPTAGRNEPRRAEALAEMDRATAEYERAKLVVVAEIKAAHASLAAAQRAAKLANSRLTVANEQFELSRKAFKLGEISAFDLYRVRQIQLEAQRMQANAEINVGVAISRLNQAQGYAP
ncbi:TolC family protein [Methylocystis sp. H4A]|uniref:TolC family protein n=1 Tax=Methylocystis sp. H4A TaxID=2785788 RepID=UPI0018C1E3B1|nr:TolC family protein [Methylocystis sp. H4A]MBG0803347.1 TolC family protein [Methylocystis sp. H4A]